MKLQIHAFCLLLPLLLANLRPYSSEHRLSFCNNWQNRRTLEQSTPFSTEIACRSKWCSLNCLWLTEVHLLAFSNCLRKLSTRSTHKQSHLWTQNWEWWTTSWAPITSQQPWFQLRPETLPWSSPRQFRWSYLHTSKILRRLQWRLQCLIANSQTHKFLSLWKCTRTFAR